MMIGVDQLWMMVEFIFHIAESIRIATKYSSGQPHQSMNSRDKLLRVSRLIKRGRKFVTAFIALSTIALIIVLSVRVSDTEQEYESDMKVYTILYCTNFTLLFVGLTLAVITLSRKLRQKQQVLQDLYGESTSVIKELWVLFVIMTVFNLSYIVRVMYILWPVAENESVYDVEEFKGLMVSQVVGIPFDIIPIAVILVLHRRNLRVI